MFNSIIYFSSQDTLRSDALLKLNMINTVA